MQSCAVSQAQAQEYAHLAKHLYKKKKKKRERKLISLLLLCKIEKKITCLAA